MESIKEKLSLDGKERLSSFPKKYNRHVKITGVLIYLVSALFILVFVLILRAFLGEDSFLESLGIREYSVGVAILVSSYIIKKKVVDPLIIKED